MKRPTVMGIDPGIKGAIAVIGDEVTEFWLLKEIVEQKTKHFDDIIRAYGIDHCFLEKAQAMPGQGVSTTFNYGVGFGRIIGWLEILAVPFTLVPPQTWQKMMHLGCSGEPKDRSRQAVTRLFPRENLVPNGCVKLHDGLADALLLAEYGRRQL